MAKEKETQAPETPPKKRNRYLLLGLPVLVLLLAAAGAGLYFLGVFSASSPARAGVPGPAEEKKELGPLLEMEDFVVNIMHGDTARFLKVGITLETKDEASKEAIKKRMPQITDAVLLLVGNKKYDDIKDLQGKMQLKADLLGRIQQLAGKGEVTNIYFTDFVVQ